MAHHITVTPYKTYNATPSSSNFPQPPTAATAAARGSAATTSGSYIRFSHKNLPFQTQSTIVKPLFTPSHVYDRVAALTTATQKSSPTQTQHDSFSRRKNGPVAFVAESLPLPCAYLRLPWPQGRPFGRLLPARAPNKRNGATDNPSIQIYRQYVKRMIVEEICSSPPYYLLRYVQFTRALGPADTDPRGRLSRKIPFLASQQAFPGLQAISIQQSIAALSRHTEQPSDDVNDARIQFTIQEYLHPTRNSDHIMVVHTSLPPWERLPFHYGTMEAGWVEKVAPYAANLLKEMSQCHLVVSYDAAQSNSQWSPNNMRQIISLIAQTVSVALSTMPLYLDTNTVSYCSPSHQEQSFLSFQIVIFPSAQFNEGMAKIRGDAKEPESSPQKFNQTSAVTYKPQGSVVLNQSSRPQYRLPSMNSSFDSSSEDIPRLDMAKKRPNNYEKSAVNPQSNQVPESGISQSLCGVWKSSNRSQKNEPKVTS